MNLGAFARQGASLGTPAGRVEIKTVRTDTVRVIEQKCPDAGKVEAIEANLEKARSRIQELENARAELKAKTQNQKAQIQRMKVNSDELKRKLQLAKGK